MGLLSSFRIFLNGFMTKSVYLPQQICFSEIHSTPSYRLKSVEEKLGLPKKPRRPLSAYYRFLKESLPSITESNPKLRYQERVSLIAKMWSLASHERKEEYIEQIKKERFDYLVRLKEYNGQLSDVDRQRIKVMKAEIAANKANLIISKERRDLGRPKKPANQFLKFFIEQRRGRGEVKQTKEEYLQFYKDIVNKWRALSDAERAKYEATVEFEEYKLAMYEWEAKMIKMGRSDLIRRKTVIPKLASKEL